MDYDAIRSEVTEMLERLTRREVGFEYKIGVLQTLLTVAILEMKEKQQNTAIRTLKNIN